MSTRARGDRGATAVLFAILMPVVLLGLGAIVIDVGSWYAERAQTQNGADAGAMAVAMSCAQGACNVSLAGPEAPDNSVGNMDTTSEVTSGFPCGNAGGVVSPGLPGCPAGVENGTTCPTPPSGGTSYVDVQNNTLNTKTGTTLVPPFLGKALLGNSYDGQTIGACAQASWGPPSSLGSGTALTMSACEWSKDTADGSLFAQVPSFNSNAPNYGYVQSVPPGLPSYLDTLTARRSDADYLDPGTGQNFYVENNIKDPHTTPRLYRYGGSATATPARDAGAETVLTTHGFGNSCKAGDSGSTAPGQFGWLSNAACTVIIDGSTYGGAPGASAAPCQTAFTASRNTGQPIFLPVYNAVSGTGSGAQYTLLGFAAFVVTGWDMTNASAGNWTVKKAPSLVTLADSSVPAGDANYCNKSFTGSNADQCIYGFFTQALIDPADLPGNDPGNPPPKNLGATAVYLSG